MIPWEKNGKRTQQMMERKDKTKKAGK